MSDRSESFSPRPGSRRWASSLAGALVVASVTGLLVVLNRWQAVAPPVQRTLSPFANEAPQAGIRFELGHSGGLLDILGTAGSGGAFVDYDQDGFLDALLLGENRSVMYRNNGDGSFTDATSQLRLPQEGSWSGCAAADYDNDGYPDLFLNGYGCARLLHNERGRVFRDATASFPLPPPGDAPLWGTSAAWGDVDRDGWVDLYIARYVRFRRDMSRYCPSPAGERRTCGPYRYEPQRGALYRSERGRRFTDVTLTTGADRVHGKAWGAVFFDMDADGWQDLYVTNDEMPGDLLRNLRGSRFQNVGVKTGTAFDAEGRVHGGMGVDAGDYDGDGRLDLVVTTYENEPYSLYQNNGPGFTDVSSLAGLAEPTRPKVGWGAGLVDWDSDGRLDLFFTNGHVIDSDRTPTARPDLVQPMQLFRNAGARFVPVSLGALEAPIVGRGAAFGDYDNDGFTDILVIDMEGPALLLRNQEGCRWPRAHWLGVSLTGTRSNRDGLGARVEVRSGGATQVAEVRTSGSVFSSNDPRLRFGLGPASAVDAITVRWPSGTVDHLTGIPADRYVRIVEGSSSRKDPSRPSTR